MCYLPNPELNGKLNYGIIFTHWNIKIIGNDILKTKQHGKMLLSGNSGLKF